MLKDYPGREPDEEISFSKLEEDSGFGWFPSGGAVIEEEVASITDHITQKCQFTFFIVYRAHFRTEGQRKDVQNMLDNMGRWLEQQTLAIEGKKYRLSSYPELSGEREIEQISRKTMAYLDNVQESGCEDWAIGIVLKYRNEYDR